MSILDELRQKADQKKSEQLQRESTQQNLEAIYQATLLPKMQYFYDGLSETVKHLNFLEEAILINNYSSRYPEFGQLCQKNYKINTDGYSGLADYNRLLQINVSFFCEADGEFTYALESKRLIEAEVTFLHARRLEFSWQNKGTAIESAEFTIRRKIPVRFKLEIDYPLSLLKVTINNHENLEFFSKNYSPEQLDEDLLDVLVSYLMRRDNRLIRLDISDARKTAIQNQLAFQQQADLDKISCEEDKASFKIANPVKAIFSKYSKKN